MPQRSSNDSELNRKKMTRLKCNHCSGSVWFYEDQMNEVGYYQIYKPTDGPKEVNAVLYCEDCINRIVRWFNETAELPPRKM